MLLLLHAPTNKKLIQPDSIPIQLTEQTFRVFQNSNHFRDKCTLSDKSMNFWRSIFFNQKRFHSKSLNICIIIFRNSYSFPSLPLRCGLPLVLYLCMVGLEVTKASSYVLGISEDWVLEVLTAPLMRYSQFGKLTAVPKGTWVDLVDPYLLGMLRH